MRRKSLVMLGSALSVLIMIPAAVRAQNPPPPPPRFGRGPADGIGFLGFEGGIGGKVVTGAPYSCVVTTEHTETLADGNQIDQKTNVTVARDSEGRVYRQESLPAIGNYTSSGNPPQVTLINDPVAGYSYVLDPVHKSARKLKLPPPRNFGANGNNAPQFQRGNGANQGASLGTQTMDGVLVQGTQDTRTIPSGRVGNTQPIQIVTTRWYSTELGIYVQTQVNDPQRGKTTTTLNNLSRNEPDPSLFQIPADYTITQGNARGPRGGGPRPPAQ